MPSTRLRDETDRDEDDVMNGDDVAEQEDRVRHPRPMPLQTWDCLPIYRYHVDLHLMPPTSAAQIGVGVRSLGVFGVSFY